MASSAAVRRVDDEFSGARSIFEGFVGKLSDDKALLMTHDELEGLVVGEGRGLLRQLLEDHLQLRALLEERQAAVVGSDKVKRNHVRQRTVNLTTMVGDVDVTRLAYSARGTASLVPADAQLNMPAESFSLSVRKQVAWLSPKMSYDDVVEQMERAHGLKLGKRQVEELASRAAVDFDAYYAVRDQLAVGAPPPSPSTPPFLVLSTDAKGVVMLPAHLRPGTKKRAATSTKKLTTRLSKGEKKDRKRMAQVAAVYDVEPWVRRVDDILLLTRKVPDERRPPPPRATNKRVWASIEKDAVPVIVEAFKEGLRRDPTKERPWAVLVDGNASQLDTVKRCAKQFSVSVVIILDLIHVLEYLWKAVFSFHREGTPEAEDWVLTRLRAILEGKAVDVAAGMRSSATKRKLKGKKREAVDTCADYLLNHKEYLHYDECLARGLPIATGVIEGACRHLVKDRMDITGARWSLTGAEAVLRLRSLVASKDFDEYWAFHVEQEFKRNHLTNYAEPPKPVVLRPAKYRRGGSHLKLVK